MSVLTKIERIMGFLVSFLGIFVIFLNFSKGVPFMSMSVFATKINSAVSVLAPFKNVRMYGLPQIAGVSKTLRERGCLLTCEHCS